MTNSPYACVACHQPIPFGVVYCPHCGHVQRSDAGDSWLGERRLVTILFADLAAFTATSEDADPEDVIDMLNQVFTRLMAEADLEGGYLDKTVGDQLMVLFGVPRSHEDDPSRAVRTALRMQAAMEELAPVMREKVGHAFKINIGINTGLVVWGRVGPAGRTAATVIGDAVNLASRLQQVATGGQVVVSESTYFQTRRFFEYEVLDPVQVKGKKKPASIFMPLNPRQSVRAGKQAILFKIPLIERQQEVHALQAHWQHAVAGEAQFVLISGEAGAGKSRLLMEFVDGLSRFHTDKQPLVLQTCGQSASVGNYSPLSDLLTQLFNLSPEDNSLRRRRKVEDRAEILGITGNQFLPLMGYLLGWYEGLGVAKSEEEVEFLRHSALNDAAKLVILQATRRPVLIIIDDLQWADANTLQWFNRLTLMKQLLAPEQPENPVRLMIVGTSRPQLGGSNCSLHIVDEIITLAPLSDKARRSLIEQLLPGRGLPQSLVERLSHDSGGNPFYLEETAQGLVQSGQLVRQNGAWQLTRPVDQIFVPHSVEALVMAHLDALDPAARMVLQYAAVVGLEFGYDLLAAITPVENLDSILIDLEQRGLICETTSADPGEIKRIFTFTQAMVREVAYRSLLRKTRRSLHEQIARLAEVKSPAEKPNEIELLAHHYAAGGNSEKTITYNWVAGRRALDLHNHEEAYRHLNRAWVALKQADDPDPDTLRAVADALADAATFTGNFSEAAICYQAAQELTESTPENLAKLFYKLGRLHFYQNNIEEADRYYQRSQELATNDPPLMAQLDAELRLLYDLG